MRALHKIKNILFAALVLHIVATLAYFSYNRDSKKIAFGIQSSEALAGQKKQTPRASAAPVARVPVARVAVDPAVKRQEGINLSKGFRDLSEKRAEVERRSDMLNKREDKLLILQKDIEGKLIRLESLRTEILSYLTQKKQEEELKLKKLANVYESIPPENAGAILNGLELPLASEIILRMEPKKAGRLLPFVKPAMAQRISEYIVSKKMEVDSAVKKVP